MHTSLIKAVLACSWSATSSPISTNTQATCRCKLEGNENLCTHHTHSTVNLASYSYYPVETWGIWKGIRGGTFHTQKPLSLLLPQTARTQNGRIKKFTSLKYPLYWEISQCQTQLWATGELYTLQSCNWQLVSLAMNSFGYIIRLLFTNSFNLIFIANG